MIDEFFKLRGQGLWRLAEFTVGIGQSGIREAGDRERRHLVQAADVIGHQIRASGAVHPHSQQVVIGDRGIKRINGLAAQHSAVALDGHRGDHGDRNAQLAPQLLNSDESGFEIPGIETGLDQQ